jgi:hypothetical protein
MGQSTDGLLFFGITHNEEEDECSVARTLGFKVTEEDEHDSYGLLERNLPEGLSYDSHCSCEYSMPIIHACLFQAWRGSPVEIKELPEIEPELVAKLEAYAEKLGWDGPRWYLASMWC